ncbi:protein of unknown function [Azotobacter beijerinckii]|uniref:DUF4350 domain-containing protein n=1 Tax=Azotobacter beijerinckii TaxID=170623 RepID=A0A1H6XW60_9GAMM|nr:DUF4350 domain-containing protein [Azotobacter beijerinckii]SEJ32406.1 protein of unknown function [Azotobacter beijerinckii]
MSGRQRLVAIGIGLALVLFGAWLLGRLQPYREIVERGPTPQARANPYLAAELFLRRQGLDVRRGGGLEALPARPDGAQTLLLLGEREHMTPRQAERVLAWTAAGGRLVFVAERLWDEKAGRSGDLLLDGLGIQQYLSAELAIGEPRDGDRRRAELARFYLQNEKTPAYLAFDTAFHLYDSRHRTYAWANSGEATHLLQVHHGRGTVTVLSDAWIWENPNIGDHDHAWLLWYLSRDSQITLVHRVAGEGLATLLLRHFPAALLALALLAGGLLWRAGLRRGPPLPAARPARRQLEEHLRADADFLLRRGGQASLLQGLQQDIRRRAGHRELRFAELPEEAQWQLLARFGRLPAEHIGQLMRPPDQALSAADFTRQVADLQRLRNTL